MMKTNFFSKALAIAMMLLGLTFVSCDEYDNPLPADWDGSSPNLPLTLEAVNEGATMNVTFTSTLPETTTIEYSTDGGKSWRFFTISGGKTGYKYGGNPDQSWTWNHQDGTPYTRTLSNVHQILIKADNASYGSDETKDLTLPDDYRSVDTRYLNIKVDADCYIYGNMMSMIGGEKFASKTDLSGKYNFYRMFEGNPKLKSHPTKNLLLPATNVTDSCYYAMFAGCSAMTVAPELPATKMANGCYYSMFSGCTALTKAPALPATTLADNCYCQMFNFCTALATAPALPATIMAEGCYNGMFASCAALTTAPALPATTLADGCYSGMFRSCAVLTTAPALPATSLAEGCYQSMFLNCYALATAPALLATNMKASCYNSMFNSCTSLTTAPALPATTLANSCYKEMFVACTALTTAPEKLPATTMADECCYGMFNGCTALTTAPELPATTLAKSCYSSMFKDCTNLAKAPVLPAKILKDECYTNMFYGCTSLNYIKCLATSIDATLSPTLYWVDGVAATGTFVHDASVGYAGGEFWDPTVASYYWSTTNCGAPALWTPETE